MHQRRQLSPLRASRAWAALPFKATFVRAERDQTGWYLHLREDSFPREHADCYVPVVRTLLILSTLAMASCTNTNPPSHPLPPEVLAREVVFVGTVRSTASNLNDGYSEIVFDAETFFRGRPERTITVHVLMGVPGGCSMPVGMRYLVPAERDQGGTWLRTSCLDVRREETAGRDLAYVRGLAGTVEIRVNQ